MNTQHRLTPESTTRSLRTGTDSKTRWYPIAIETWEKVIKSFSFEGAPLIPDEHARKNLAYTLQYLEYLEQTVRELSLSNVLVRQTIKSYVIVAIGSVECLLFYLIRASGVNENNLFEIIKRVCSKKLLGEEYQYDELHRFRKLRNKVHIYEDRDNLCTDYQSFDKQELKDMRSILYEIATAPALGLTEGEAEEFEFLRARLWSEDT